MDEKMPEFIGAGYTDWASSVLGDDSAEIKARVAERVASLTSNLGAIIHAENLVVLVGSGASLGITNADAAKQPPRMSDLWDRVKELPEFVAVSHKLSPDTVAKNNLEHVLSDAQARSALSPDDGDLKDFISAAEDVVWRSCNFVDSKSILDSHEMFLRKVARRSERVARTQIFTTNYDRAFEISARRTRFNIIDGFGYGGTQFDGASFDLDYVRRRPHEPLTLEPSVFQYFKLHGSVDWNRVDGEIEKTFDGSKPISPVLIYPSATKYQISYQQPYFELMSRFQIALRQPDIGLIIVGFGFNDDHLSAPIIAAIRSNPGLRAVFASPEIADEGARSSTFADIEGLIRKGDQRLTMLAGTFDDLVRYLPSAPDRDERDLHVNRLKTRG